MTANTQVIEKLNYFITSQRIPNIIFHGSSGSGKRTIVGEFIYRIYNGERARIKTNVMFVNCAHGKGIKFIRDELKHFSKSNIQCNDNNLFKSIVLYNADELTIDAQSALRRCIELFSHNTRFFIVVENKYKLLKPILSRFCKIYVPDNNVEPFPELIPNYCSLHIIKNDAVYGPSISKNSYIADIIGSTSLETNTHRQFMEIADRLYEAGISCLDILEYLGSLGEASIGKASIGKASIGKASIGEASIGEASIGEASLVKLRFCYNKIKSEFRSEKMLMLYLFDFAFLRSNTNLKNVSFL